MSILPAKARIGAGWLLMLFGMCCLSVNSVRGDETTTWRFFEASEGLGDSWTSYITVGPSGKVWVSHGSVDKLSCLDGWPAEDGGLAQIFPSPGSDLKVYENSSGQLWSVYSKGIQLFRDGKWIKYPVDDINNFLPPAGLRTLIPFLPGGPNQIYYLLPNRLMLFDANTNQRKIVKGAKEADIGRFIDMVAARQGGIWITGRKGIARLRPPLESSDARWREYSLEGVQVKDIRSLVEGENEELFAVAVNLRNDREEIIHFDGAKWRILPGGGGKIRKVWPGLDGSYWTLKDKNTLSLVANGKIEIQEKKEILSGDLHEVVTEANGVFWLTTSHGLARSSPSIWRTPTAVKKVDARIHAIHEDAKGRIWFAAVDRLLLFHEGQWKQYPLPRNTETYSYLTQAISSLPDGRIAICTYHYSPFLLLFNPEKECFEYVIPASGDTSSGLPNRVVGLIAPRRDGKIWVQILDYLNPSNFRIEIFDGKAFKPFLNLREKWNIDRLQFISETENGDLWFGGQTEDSLGLYRNGNYTTLGPEKDSFKGGFLCSCEIEKGKVWVGGRNDIFQFDGRNWSLVRTGLNIVYSIVKGRDGIIWVASGTGVHRYFKGSWVTNTVEDGLPNTAAFTIAEDSRNRVWAGTIRGLSLFHPEADTIPPQTIISSKNNLQETPPDKEVRLLFSGIEKWKQTRADRLLFSYRLDNGPWSVFQTGNIAVFKKLPYGWHNFEVRAMDVNLNYDHDPASFKFRVLSPWYREPGFLAIVGAGSIIIIFLLGFALRRHFFLEKLVVERTRDLQEANVQLQGNLSELKKAEEALKEEHARQVIMLENERLLARVASSLNSADAFYEILNELLRTIAEATKIDHIGLYRLDLEGKKAERLSSWFSPLCSPEINDLPAMFDFRLTSLIEHLNRGEIINSADLSTQDEKEIDFLTSQGQGSFFILPVWITNRLIGCIFFNRIHYSMWKPEEGELFRTIADIIANGWQRFEHLQARMEADRKQTEAVQMAEKAARLASIGVMASGITHEINQPLNSLRIITEGVLIDIEHQVTASQSEYAEMFRKMFRQINRIDEIIKHMRAFWIYPVHVVQENFNLNEAVKNALSLIDSQIFSHGITLDLVLNRQALLIRGNQIHLEQIVINLVVNSMHVLDEIVSEDKLIRVVIRKKATRAVVKVEDNGRGFPEGEEENLFDPFYSTKKPGEGMGLGLAIVKRFVEGMGGSIQARNKKTGGAEFIVELPIVLDRIKDV